ncbi:LuxR C-terminal-related transcriptional regulator [Pseudomonas sp. DTU_2021_1001937_2_SI_NGA_ILE_001]|uniref:helix-turn-helix transcriptional regulator n=1 Tax=Pseudomonas sp. DTU_2021_1001937_2_SI_NGA_ILE_001 TaxID=3077589 RepID=UPI0028FC30AD|nr:LuxR C-terminal-related transcriptional regulator [Pseudomonas sp. DTU_2021_1001937_2_SI_NGA_ILE_001]WNW10924.1 LuxR C-terminal-related transcriptional regulator [Pseudomonas sp. DTU_2021_1001937_2_SI_NGA_ILE_001]
MNLLVRQMLSSIAEPDGRLAIENALHWLCQECHCTLALFYQFKGPLLLTCVGANLPPAQADFFLKDYPLADDPVVRHCRNQLGFVDWRDALRLYPAPPNYLQALRRAGLLPAQSYGYASHCSASTGVISVCTLGGLQRHLDNEDKYLVSSLVPVLHLVGRGVPLRSQALSERELEILRWAREGKTNHEISRIRAVSESTVKYHFKAIYGKLGVANRAQAVGEALCRGLIH